MIIKKTINRLNNDGAAKPQLTSLVDVLTVLLIFLVRTFSAEGSPVNPVSTIELPLSSSKKPAEIMTSVEITQEQLQVNGKMVASLNELTSDSLYIPALFAHLPKDKAKISEVMIQSDRDIEFSVIKKIMFTCSKAGATDFKILVINEE